MKKIIKKINLNKEKREAYFVYILECVDKTFYIGSTNNLDKRLYAHNRLKSGAKYTSGRRPVKLVYSENCKDYSVARKREGELKRLTKKEKESLCKLIKMAI